MTDEKLTFPVPPDGLWWEVTSDPDGDFELYLCQTGVFFGGADDAVGRDRIRAKDANPAEFASVAENILARHAKAQAFNGTYHQNKEN